MDTPPPQTRSWLPFGLTLEQVSIWLLFLGIVWALRHFFAIVFMTYIMSYVAERIVRVLMRDPDGLSTRWIRKPIIGIVYLTALAMGYLVAQSVFPKAVDQGKWLLSQVNEINLEQVRDDLLAKTIGRIEFTRYRHSDEYPKALARYITEHSNPLGFKESKETAAQIRAGFRASVLTTEAAAELSKLRAAADVEPQYRQWLKTKVVEPELNGNPARKQRLYDEEDRVYEAENKRSFELIKDQQGYKDDRHDKVVNKLVAELAQERKHHERFEKETAGARAQERVAAMPANELEERFRSYFRDEVPRRFPTFRYTYEQVAVLETATSEEEFRSKQSKEEQDPAKLEDKFQRWKEMELARQHPMASMVGDTSKVVRQHLPQITGWVTDVINNVLAFCLHALLSLMLSFMIVWEIPRLSGGFAAVKGTRVEPLFNEVAPGIVRLGQVIGVAFSAQFVIASINGLLAFVAFMVLGLPSSVFLSLLVLVCCLIPYVGIFLAAPPVLIVALQQGGLPLSVKAAIALLLVHELEAWILSPKILGEFLQLSPILLVLVLCVAQPLFGIWGLLLGVPVAVYLINDVLLQPMRPRRDGTSPPL
jgi:predicted PurR-regulated permease PerM